MAAKINILNSSYVSVARHPAGALVRFFIILFLILLTAAALVLLIPWQAKAESPHGPFSSSTDRCGRCHRMHDAKADKLLSEENSVLFCTSCHAKGSGADTAVMEGALIRPTVPGGDVFVAQGTLLGGGFNNIGNTAIATSSHRLGEAGTPFGSDANATVVLTCLSCHTPHQGPNYRLLRRRPTGGDTDLYVTWNGPYPQPDGTLDYAFDEHDLSSNPGTQYLTFNYRGGMSAWCSGCHTNYMATNNPDGTPNPNRGGPGATPYDAGDAEGAKVRYRHAVDVVITGGTTNPINGITYNLTTDLPLQDLTGDGRSSDDTILCLTCHRVHGTAAEMNDPALQTGNRGFLPAGTDSMLLRQDDRKICKSACHRIPD